MKTFIQHLNKFIDKSRLIDDQLLCYAYGTDASMYRLNPKLVILVETALEVQKIIILANKLSIALTFRAAGTSLSGQAITDSVLVVLSNYAWLNYTIHNDGQQISLEPGIIGAHANLFLKPYNKKIGPDPASINSCKIGGIVANNSSGMCCGVTQNTYQTMKSIKLILANGSSLDTADENSKDRFIKTNPELITGIKQIYAQIHKDKELVALIRHKFKIKNTTGYSLNAFIDYTDPVDILAHLMIGSEGTLGFIREITYNCVDDNPYKAVSLIYCDNLEQIIDLSLDVRQISIDAMELLDITSLVAVKGVAKNTSYLPAELKHDTSAMLIEISDSSEIKLKEKTEQLQLIVAQHPVSHQIKFTRDSKISQDLWDIRRGILPIIGNNAPANSTAIIEDIAVAIKDLPCVISRLRELFTRYNYTNAAIVGHILAGNIHFMFTPSFNSQDKINNYDEFMKAVAQIVAVDYKGSLKAEHGCGRNMAAFVELEWGQNAYNLMWQIKNLFDPNNILNPGVILNHDSKIHVQNLKQLHTTNPIIDKCIECGFCESVCPSRKLTLTPRQRISTYRYINTLKNTNKSLYNKYIRQFQYYGIDTCATTGLCASSCPVGINTGKFILELKQQPNTFTNSLWINNFNWFVKFNRALLYLANFTGKVFGKQKTYQISRRLHKVMPIIPIYPTTMPEVQTTRFINSAISSEQKILYIPSCNNRIFADCETAASTKKIPSSNVSIKDAAQATHGLLIYNAIHRLLEHIGYEVIYPDKLANTCCGQVFDSKGNPQFGNNMKKLLNRIIQNSPYPVLIDNSSCLYNLLNDTNALQISSIIDIIEKNLTNLQIKKRYAKLALHIDCSSKKLAQDSQIIHLLQNFADEVIIPDAIHCCGFAGNKGFINPELNQVALSTLANQISDCNIGVTFNRNCQIGLSLHGNKQYISLAELVLNCI